MTYIIPPHIYTIDGGKITIALQSNPSVNVFDSSQVTLQKAGSWVGSGAMLQTSYVIPHTLGVVPSIILLQSTLPGSAGSRYVTNKTATTFTVVFLSAPGAGSSNLGFDWVAIP